MYSSGAEIANGISLQVILPEAGGVSTFSRQLNSATDGTVRTKITSICSKFFINPLYQSKGRHMLPKKHPLAERIYICF